MGNHNKYCKHLLKNGTKNMQTIVILIIIKCNIRSFYFYIYKYFYFRCCHKKIFNFLIYISTVYEVSNLANHSP